jgi:hypothetical protein
VLRPGLVSDQTAASLPRRERQCSTTQARIYSRYIALQIDAIEKGRLAKHIATRDQGSEHGIR